MISATSHLQYANALHKVATNANAERQILTDLESLKTLFEEEKFKALLKQISYLERDALQKILSGTFGGSVHAITLNMLVLLGKGRKLSIVPKILDAYSNLYHTAKKISEIKIASARKLDSEEELQVIDQLQKKLDRPVSVKFTQNPKLIGGLQIYERGYLTDLSIANYLTNLKKKLMATD